MAADMNELMQLAAARSNVLAEKLDEATESIQNIHTHAKTISGAIENNTGEIRSVIKKLEALLDDAEEKIIKAREEAKTELDDATKKAETLDSELDDLATKVVKELDDVETAEDETQASIDSQFSETADNFQERAAQLGKIAEDMKKNVDEAVGALRAFAQKGDDARKDLGAKGGEWHNVVDDITESVPKESEVWVDSLEQLLQEGGKAVFDAANEVIGAHNAAMTAIKEKFTVEAARELEESLRALNAELEQLGEMAEGRQGELSAKVQEIAGKVQALLPDLQSVRGVLETVTQLQ